MSTSIFVVKSTINDVYLKPKNKFKIPRFQRQYTWEEKEIEEFWDTIVSEEPVFLGTIIFDVKERDENNIIEIVDGQQRYLTIQILGAVIRDLISEKGKSEKITDYKIKANGFNKILIGTPDDFDDNRFDNFLIPGDSIRDFFKKHIQDNPPSQISDSLKVNKNSEEEKIKKAYLKFKSLILVEIAKLSFEEQYNWLRNLIDNKLGKHFFVKIEIDNENLAYEIFETVNAKGVDLSVADLIKNQIFKNVVGPDDKHLDGAKEKWNQILEILSSIEFSLKDFLSYYWTSKYEYVSDKKLYSSIRNKFKTTKKDWENFLNDLNSNAEYLSLILNGGFEDILLFFENNRSEATKVYNSLRVLRSTKAKTWIILYLCLFRNLDSQNKKHKITFQLSNRWEIIQKFTFLYFQILSLPGNWYFKLISDFCKKIEDAIENKKDKKIIIDLFSKNLFSEFNTKMPTYSNFDEGFKTIEYREDQKSRIIIRYVLNELEEKIGGNTSEGYNEEKVSIEHILPRTPKEWKVTKKEIKPFVNTLGNLTIISKKINGELENKIISEKIKIIKAKGSSIKLVNQLVEKIESNEWPFDKIRTDKNFEAIKNRFHYLSKEAYEIWNDDLKKKMGV